MTDQPTDLRTLRFFQSRENIEAFKAAEVVYGCDVATHRHVLVYDAVSLPPLGVGATFSRERVRKLEVPILRANGETLGMLLRACKEIKKSCDYDPRRGDGGCSL